MIKALYISLVALVIFASSANAGFEWVPSNKESAPAPQARPTAPKQHVGTIETAPAQTDETITMVPLPLSEKDNIEPAPVTPIIAAPPASPMKVIDLQDKEEGLAVVKTTPQPPQTSTKVIMSQDSPQNAVDMIPGDKHVFVDPFPEIEKSEVEEQAPTPITQNQPAPAPLPASQKQVMGFGSEVPLAIALGQIIPPSFALSFGDNVNPGAKVSWNGGKGWEEVIVDMVAPLGLTAVIRNNIVHIKNTNPSAKMEKHANVQPQIDNNVLEITLDETPNQKIQTSRENITDPGQVTVE